MFLYASKSTCLYSEYYLKNSSYNHTTLVFINQVSTLEMLTDFKCFQCTVWMLIIKNK